ncbi:BZ3500_MvSof-1268-A1-R1_Chr8-2g10300 [Microbotryum saponariae]|uniref:BZ3500_MvSof-1268-A1-R1_Chr8-2g10300 protein n=1 Tax=Microbotryum saponariae TaxID=289078 RepID=A0A2X0LC75_9BASI|nr:BZ3500_MvSof-1268-A1-R1_Chr8-2g10300 [Microbotryum saponariae]SDA02131.1 BZ3501_MvSof-1269-A2-R1_Chr8-2g10049 [Microbotryum saponariae]
MRQSIRKMQLDLSQLRRNVSPQADSVQLARWPTRWHPSFAPNRVTCRTILCASLISTIEKTLNFAEVSN